MIHQKYSKWHTGQMVVITGDTDDPEWTERFGTGLGVVVNPMGKSSRWVIIEVLDAGFMDCIGSNIRFPKSSLRPMDAKDGYRTWMKKLAK